MENNSRYYLIISQVAHNNDMPVDLVDRVYKSYWHVIKSIMLELPLKNNITQSDFKKLRPNINIHGLGKFYVLYPKYVSIKNSYRNKYD